MHKLHIQKLYTYAHAKINYKHIQNTCACMCLLINYKHMHAQNTITVSCLSQMRTIIRYTL